MEMIVTPKQKLEAVELTPESRTRLTEEWGAVIDETIPDGTIYTRDQDTQLLVSVLPPAVFAETYDIVSEAE